MPSTPRQIDTAIEVIAPENIAFAYHVAGPFRRFPAWLLDFLFRAVGMLILGVFVSLVSPVIGSLGIAAWVVLLFLVSWFYGGLFETYWNGQTPGKQIMGLRVLSTNGRPINGYQAVLRNLLRGVDIYFIGVVVMACNRRFQRLGDLVCRTMVIVEERPWLGGVAAIDDPRAFQLASYLPSDLRISRSMALALAHYAERRHVLSPARRREVASHIAQPLLLEYHLPANTSYDLLLCSIYYRVFIAERSEDEEHAARAGIRWGIRRPVEVPAPGPTGTEGSSVTRAP